ncbi:hypothetical protein XENORESO_021040 [Xenotaenia resolanae]|uniref:Uncharacterized protein n=1 Tax=Xenotaenia resolanae TaxID=208358 RepID=A0ABV0WZA8_9TELE
MQNEPVFSEYLCIIKPGLVFTWTGLGFRFLVHFLLKRVWSSFSEVTHSQGQIVLVARAFFSDLRSSLSAQLAALHVHVLQISCSPVRSRVDLPDWSRGEVCPSYRTLLAVRSLGAPPVLGPQKRSDSI